MLPNVIKLALIIILPCDGEVGGYFGCAPEKRDKKVRKLREEGIIVNGGRIDLNKYLYSFNPRNA